MGYHTSGNPYREGAVDALEALAALYQAEAEQLAGVGASDGVVAVQLAASERAYRDAAAAARTQADRLRGGDTTVADGWLVVH